VVDIAQMMFFWDIVPCRVLGLFQYCGGMCGDGGGMCVGSVGTDV
jgi:hypothetical protein